MSIKEDAFGTAKDPISGNTENIRRFTLANPNHMEVQVITLGATITSIKVPDAKGNIEDVALGFDEIAGYINPKPNPYMGSTLGRVANRIGKGTFFLNGAEFKVSINFRDRHILHGGFIGFDSVNWTVTEVVHEKCLVKMQHVSADGQEGFPGEVTTTVSYQLTGDNCFHVRFNATTTKPTLVNLTNHAYFNLGGHAAGPEALYDHQVWIKADKILAIDDDLIPSGELLDVGGTPYDLRTISNLGSQMKKLPEQGFDNNYCVNLENNAVTVIAKAVHPKSGRWMEVASDKPGVQFYTGNNLPDTTKKERPLDGKQGAKYVRHGAICFEPQDYPDAINHPNFPPIVVKPGDIYEHNFYYKFGAIPAVN